MVNPYHTEEFSKTIFKALFMKNKERQKRMKKLRESIYQDDIWNWIGNLISDLP
jgi:trehalose-6-phosphate synthase